MLTQDQIDFLVTNYPALLNTGTYWSFAVDQNDFQDSVWFRHVDNFTVYLYIRQVDVGGVKYFEGWIGDNEWKPKSPSNQKIQSPDLASVGVALSAMYDWQSS